jgi:hypothetical protein
MSVLRLEGRLGGTPEEPHESSCAVAKSPKAWIFRMGKHGKTWENMGKYDKIHSKNKEIPDLNGGVNGKIRRMFHCHPYLLRDVLTTNQLRFVV